MIITENGLWITEEKNSVFDLQAIEKQIQDIIKKREFEEREITFYTNGEGVRQFEEAITREHSNQYERLWAEVANEDIIPATQEFDVHVHDSYEVVEEMSLKDVYHNQLQNGDITTLEYLDKISDL